jgi:4-diphosphocytidyl-2-C-methyl-D-erythritol kinase
MRPAATDGTAMFAAAPFAPRTGRPLPARPPAMTPRADSTPFPGLPAGPDAFVAFAPAKVNPYLEVLGRRPDGYHAVETLVLAVDLFDTLEVRRAPDGVTDIACDAPGVPTGPTNLVWKAAEALRLMTGTDFGAAIRLTKRIPHEAGLGGGSSDAAATLAALNVLWGLNLSRRELLPVAAAVGSDVGAFLAPPAGWCTGRGELVEPEAVGAEFHLVVVKPPVGCPTADVYRRVAVPETRLDGSAVRAAVRVGDAERLARGLHNRLQPAAFALRPEVEAVYHRLIACGPLGCLLSGSGASVFAVCRGRADALRVAREYVGRCGPSPAGGSADRVYPVRSVRWP